MVSTGQERTERNLVCPQGLRILWLSILWCILNWWKLFLILDALGNTSVFILKRSRTPHHIPELLENLILSTTFLGPLSFLKQPFRSWDSKCVSASTHFLEFTQNFPATCVTALVSQGIEEASRSLLKCLSASICLIAILEKWNIYSYSQEGWCTVHFY